MSVDLLIYAVREGTVTETRLCCVSDVFTVGKKFEETE